MGPIQLFPSYASLAAALEPLDLLSETVIDPNTQVKYKNVYQIFPQHIFEKARKELKEYIDDWKEHIRDDYPGHEHTILYFKSARVRDYTTIEFGEDHKLVSPEAFINQLTGRTDNFSLHHQERLKRIAKEIMIIAVERFALEKGFVGKKDIRIQLKTFNYYIPKPLREPEIKNFSLKWHYDYEAAETLGIPLFNEFTQDAPGDLLFARNGYDKPCKGGCGPNVNEVIPIESTITKVPYPENGGLLFEGQQGAQIHCPSPITIPANKRGVFTKMLIQVVSYDKEWMQKKE